MFQTVHAAGFSEPAPDGSMVRPLVRTDLFSVGIIELQPGRTSAPVKHQTVEEIWYVLEGSGELWRKADSHEEVVALQPGTCLTIPVGVSSQFRASDAAPLRMLMLTTPPWPGDAEAEPCDGPWRPVSPR